MKVLLTGATGLIGKVVGHKLVARGHEVFVVTRSAEKARQSLDFPCTPIVANLVSDQIKDSQIYEIEGVAEEIAREAFRLAAAKLPMKTTFVSRQVM